MSLYELKVEGYFSNARKEIQPLLPERADRVLEIGCGEAVTLEWVCNQLNCSWTGGVEYFADAAEKARTKVDWIAQGSVEEIELPFDENTLDLILCLDVLEHLWDPWSVIRRLSTLLKPGGSLIVSIPNVKHHSVIFPLLLHGRFDYRTEGVLDKTHIRFFTRATALELIESNGLVVDTVSNSGIFKGSKSYFANLLTFKLFQVLFETQYLIKAVKL